MEYVYRTVDIASAPLSEMDTEILEYWNARRGGAFAPNWNDFRLDELPPRAVPWCGVVDVVHDPLDFIFRFWGTIRGQLFGEEVTGQRLSGADHVIARASFEQNVAVVETRRPLYFLAQAVRDGGEKLEYGYFRLPLSSDGEAVDKIVSVNYQPDLRDVLHSLYGTLPAHGVSAVARRRSI